MTSSLAPGDSDDLDGQNYREHYRLYISNTFMLKDEYNYLYKKVLELYIKKVVASGISVVYLPEEKMQEKFCSNDFNPVFNTLNEQQAFLTTKMQGLILS